MKKVMDKVKEIGTSAHLVYTLVGAMVTVVVYADDIVDATVSNKENIQEQRVRLNNHLIKEAQSILEIKEDVGDLEASVGIIQTDIKWVRLYLEQSKRDSE